MANDSKTRKTTSTEAPAAHRVVAAHQKLAAAGRRTADASLDRYTGAFERSGALYVGLVRVARVRRLTDLAVQQVGVSREITQAYVSAAR